MMSQCCGRKSRFHALEFAPLSVLFLMCMQAASCLKRPAPAIKAKQRRKLRRGPREERSRP